MTNNDIIKEFEALLKSERAEAYKEFAERLKDISVFLEDEDRYVGYAVRTKDIDNLVKEMVGERE